MDCESSLIKREDGLLVSVIINQREARENAQISYCIRIGQSEGR